MGLHISAMILTLLLFLAGWFSREIIYNLGAFAVVFLWGLGWLNDKPRWPDNKILKIIIYGGFAGLTILLWFITKASFAILTSGLILTYMIVDFARER